jgi:hypothetical protein
LRRPKFNGPVQVALDAHGTGVAICEQQDATGFRLAAASVTGIR